MADDFVTVATYNQSFEAQLAKNLLENEGIQSIVAGALTSDVLFGNPALGDQIVLQVREEDAQRAAGILAAMEAAKLDEDWEEQAESGAGVWICSICGEPVSNRLSICYSCQSPREGIRTGSPRDRTAIQPPPSTLPTGEEVQKRDEITDAPAPAPAPSPPAAPALMEEMPTAEPSPTAASDDLARRALLASLSLFLLPLAWYYLLRVVLFGGEMSTKGVRHLYGALLINGLIVFFVMAFCAAGRL